MKVLLFAAFIILNWTLLSQNLVPNPGFDIISQCPSDYGQIIFAPPWVKANNGTPDLYNECSNSNGIQVPHAGGNIDSYQKQRSGTGYAGIFVYGNSNLVTYEYIEAPLLSELKKGRNYYIEFYISPDLTPIDYWHYTDAIGLALSNNFYYKDLNAHEAIPLNPVVENRGTLIKDTIGWTRINGCYTALGGEKYAIIGNFRNDSETLIEVENPNSYPYNNYFYIEDVLISLFDPLPDTLELCNNETIELKAGFLDATYHWNNGKTDSTILVQTSGQYIVEAFIANCVLSDTVEVVKLNEPGYFPSDTAVCNEESLILTSPIKGDYLWSTGSKERTITIQSSGIYEVSITNACGQFNFATNVSTEICQCEFYIPNVISPNNDGVNDKLEIFFNCDFEYHISKFSLFNRWGNNIYSANEGEDVSWNGTFMNEPVPSGVYVWILEYEVSHYGKKEKITKSGDLNILR